MTDLRVVRTQCRAKGESRQLGGGNHDEIVMDSRSGSRDRPAVRRFGGAVRAQSPAAAGAGVVELNSARQELAIPTEGDSRIQTVSAPPSTFLLPIAPATEGQPSRTPRIDRVAPVAPFAPVAPAPSVPFDAKGPPAQPAPPVPAPAPAPVVFPFRSNLAAKVAIGIPQSAQVNHNNFRDVQTAVPRANGETFRQSYGIINFTFSGFAQQSCGPGRAARAATAPATVDPATAAPTTTPAPDTTTPAKPDAAVLVIYGSGESDVLVDSRKLSPSTASFATSLAPTFVPVPGDPNFRTGFRSSMVGTDFSGKTAFDINYKSTAGDARTSRTSTTLPARTAMTRFGSTISSVRSTGSSSEARARSSWIPTSRRAR